MTLTVPCNCMCAQEPDGGCLNGCRKCGSTGRIEVNLREEAEKCWMLGRILDLIDTGPTEVVINPRWVTELGDKLTELEEQLEPGTRKDAELIKAGEALEDHVRVLASILRNSDEAPYVSVQLETAEEARQKWLKLLESAA